MDNLTIAILAGGKSARMGAGIDKTRVRILGRPLPAHIAARLAGLGNETILITNQPDNHAALGLRMYGDVWPGMGPLGGIYTALTHAQNTHTVVVAADMPFLNRDLLAHMAGLAPEVDVVVPRLAAGLEGLHAIYSKNCLAAIGARLKAGRRRIISFYDDVRVHYVDEGVINRFDPEHLSFFNVNTLADLDTARHIAARQPPTT